MRKLKKGDKVIITCSDSRNNFNPTDATVVTSGRKWVTVKLDGSDYVFPYFFDATDYEFRSSLYGGNKDGSYQIFVLHDSDIVNVAQLDKLKNNSDFTDEEIDDFKNMLYQTNVGGGAINPPSPTWYNAVENARQSKISRTMNEIEVIIIRYGTKVCSIKTTDEKYRKSIVDGAKRIATDYTPCHIEIYVNGTMDERFMIDEE